MLSGGSDATSAPPPCSEALQSHERLNSFQSDVATTSTELLRILERCVADTRYLSTWAPILPGDNKAKPLKLESVDFIDAPDGSAARIEDAISLAWGVNLCRDLVSSPPNIVTPKSLADLAIDIGKEHSDVFETEVLELPEIEERKMGAYLGVAQGSKPGDGDPRFVHLTYKPPGKALKKIALVGKALTFDSGGYNLKAGAGSMIEMMKFDMG